MAPNVLPTAAFTDSVTDLAATLMLVGRLILMARFLVMRGISVTGPQVLVRRRIAPTRLLAFTRSSSLSRTIVVARQRPLVR